jgi:hypothetical protein
VSGRWIVRIEDHDDPNSREFGPFSTVEKAQEFADKVQARIEIAEQKWAEKADVYWPMIHVAVGRIDPPKLRDAYGFVNELWGIE